MKIVIPMAGQGKRFLNAGYTSPKPLLEVDGLPVITHIVRQFSAEHDKFLFGVNEEHARKTPLTSVLKDLVPDAEIITMPYQKEGPIGVLRRLFPSMPGDEPVIVNYCDFSWVWDYPHFLETVRSNDCDGAVLCYHGFHPHLLGPNLYATVDADDGWMKAIKEKHSWHDSKMKDWTSSGTYYFKSSKLLKELCDEIESRPEWKINGEFYVSQLYQLMAEKGLKVFIYEIPFMLQWGTPEDLEEYLYWSDYFRLKANKKSAPVVYPMENLILMAGAGKRFSDAGYMAPKPFIPVDGSPMVLRSVEDLPRGEHYTFVAQREHLSAPELHRLREDPAVLTAEYIPVDKLTEGQACTALLAEGSLDPEKPLLIGACDHGMLYNSEAFSRTIESGADALILTFRGFPPVRKNPEAYGWVETDSEGRALSVSVKKPLKGDPIEHHAVTGAFWFRRAGDFAACTREMIRADSRINGEFYIDECMNFLIRAGLKVQVFEVERYVSWGTPQDLQTYEYWQRFFDQAYFHPYKMRAT